MVLTRIPQSLRRVSLVVNRITGNVDLGPLAKLAVTRLSVHGVTPSQLVSFWDGGKTRVYPSSVSFEGPDTLHLDFRYDTANFVCPHAERTWLSSPSIQRLYNEANVVFAPLLVERLQAPHLNLGRAAGGSVLPAAISVDVDYDSFWNESESSWVAYVPLDLGKSTV